MTPTARPDDVNELRDAAGTAAVRGECGLVWVEGPDAAAFLHGLLTCDVAALPVGGVADGLLLDDRGHPRAAARVLRDAPEGFTLVASPAEAAVLAEDFIRFQHSEDLEVIGPEPSAVLTVGGPATLDGAVTVPGWVPGTTDLVVDDPEAALERLGARAVPAEALEVLRVERGVPLVGVETGPRSLVQEVGLEARTVSFTKGCYLGQETVARAQHRGQVQRRLRGVSASQPLAVGAEVRGEAGAVGTITSAVVSPDHGPIGLAVLRRAVQPGARVSVDGVTGPATVVELPFR